MLYDVLANMHQACHVHGRAGGGKAAPPICLIWEIEIGTRTPSWNLDMVWKMMRRMLRLRPMPTASLATSTS